MVNVIKNGQELPHFKIAQAASLIYTGDMDHFVVANHRPPVAISQMAKPARDGNIAIREEFDAALSTNSVAAWDLFIARHPKSPLLPQALAERARLLTR